MVVGSGFILGGRGSRDFNEDCDGAIYLGVSMSYSTTKPEGKTEIWGQKKQLAPEMSPCGLVDHVGVRVW